MSSVTGDAPSSGRRAFIVDLCQRLVSEVERPEVPLSTIADMALQIAEEICETKPAIELPSRPSCLLRVIEGGRN